MSSNLISRSTVNAFTKSFSPSADPRYSYWVSRIFLLYWNFSPDTYYVSGAWSVMSVGILDNDGGVYYNSYGHESPGTTGSVGIWHLYPDGGVDNFGNVSFSYGHLTR